jgi:hypothetical protein
MNWKGIIEQNVFNINYFLYWLNSSTDDLNLSIKNLKATNL